MIKIDPLLRPKIKRVFNSRTGVFEWVALPVYMKTNWNGILTTPWAAMARARHHADKLNDQQ